MWRSHHCFRFSLLTLLTVLTTSSLWLGWHVEGARRQRIAVAALSQPGQAVTFDYQGDGVFDNEWSPSARGSKRIMGSATANAGLPWLCNYLDKHLVCRATTVRLHIDDLEEALPKLQQLKSLRCVYVYHSRVCSMVSAPQAEQYEKYDSLFVAALPGVELRPLSGFVIPDAWPGGEPPHSSDLAGATP